ncbi:hypothetical protein [Pseudovibrio sp. Ad37]|uniref:hypothetical protein n=1 Tax=Pseudovibrio sp. Ad37 TaxID=989422 RepID=UPI0007AE8723|nr:hypothetical protein [Pseudovibrio sp. Ad37]KZL16700.1 hypothetical protein PsAD37_04184 [Pseudovibrio sp. Ad37]
MILIDFLESYAGRFRRSFMRIFKQTVFVLDVQHRNVSAIAFLWFAVVCSTLFFGLGLTDAHSQEVEQIINEQNIFEKIDPCDTHHDFLEGKNTALPENCHSIATFQIENHHLNDRAYIRQLYALAGEDSPLGALALSIQAAILKVRPVTVFSYAEIADRRMSISMGQSSDIERAALYSHLLSETKRIALLSMCREDANCDLIPNFLTISKGYGTEFSYIDELDPSFSLNCLLRLDSYLTPIRDVLSSFRFKECVTKHSNLLQSRGQ